MKTAVLIAGLALVLAGCVQTREMPLAQNVYRLETEGRGLIGASQADKQTLKRAAQLTLEKGYTHFRLDGAQMSNSSQLVGFTPGMANTTVNLSGNTAYGTTTYSAPTPIRARVANIGVTVVMFRANEPGAQGALDAQQVLASVQ